MQLFPNGDFLLAALLFCREILAHLICKQIQQSGIASVNKNVLLFSTSGNCLRPCFIFRTDAAIIAFDSDRICQHKHGAVKAKRIKDGFGCLPHVFQTVILIRGSNGIFDHILTSRADAQRRGVVFHFIMCDSIRRKRLQGKRPFP